ncbi:hypothetical protein MML48_3g00009674 [Holotrichia oblita]|uniref:Uncharacterized protein n=1 Tax=Holotrichia oblita TaxID=644536 RepID=A0ACB9TBT6_HOLOL|nr:hypothetical protein MML48_3g00009674 [Holotrichia oblita]
MAERSWIIGFLQRHQEISVRQAQSMNPARAQKLNKFIIKDYFEKLKTVLQELDLMDEPERIYNVDEKGCRLTLHHQQTVLAKKGAKLVHLVAPEHGENVSIVACANASGVAIPPTVLFKGKRMKPEWKDNLPHGSLALMTSKGSMNVQTFTIWLEHLAKYKLEGKCLLIFDGASCHLDPSIVDVAERHNITLLCLPSNTTHELPPMDKAVFRSFEHHWDEQVLLFWTKYKDRALTKQRFGEIFSVVWDKAMTPANIKSGFSATGIFPYNPDAIPEVAFASSIFTEEDFNENPDNIEPNTIRHRSPSPQPGCSHKSMPEKPHLDEVSNPEKQKAARKTTPNTEMLETPAKVEKRTKHRKKAINSRALVVTKNVFSPSDKDQQTTLKKCTTQFSSCFLAKKSNKKVDVEKWFCKIWSKEEAKDMRLCSTCLDYVHEECVGLTKFDKKLFICPDCIP